MINRIKREVTMNNIEKPNFKPEFGNVEHIEKLKEYQRRQEALENSNRYKVNMEMFGDDDFIVEAENEEEAEEKAYKQFLQSLLDAADLNIKVIGKVLPEEYESFNKINDKKLC
jgi:hypothetical protein